MELQNTSINFIDNTITGLYTNIVYYIQAISNIETLKTQFELIFNISIKQLVGQLTADQHLSQPRLIINPGFENIIVNLSDIQLNHPQLYDELIIAKTQIKSEIQKQINLE